MTMKTKRNVFPTLLFLAAIGASGQALSATFGELDANQDGELSTEEAGRNVELMKVWSSVDKDANGTIDRAEFSAFETRVEKQPAPEQTPGRQPADPMLR